MSKTNTNVVKGEPPSYSFWRSEIIAIKVFVIIGYKIPKIATSSSTTVINLVQKRKSNSVTDAGEITDLQQTNQKKKNLGYRTKQKKHVRTKSHSGYCKKHPIFTFLCKFQAKNYLDLDP